MGLALQGHREQQFVPTLPWLMFSPLGPLVSAGRCGSISSQPASTGLTLISGSKTLLCERVKYDNFSNDV
jgi:hypothetical protein